MAQTRFYQPDAAAMERLLEEYRGTPTGVVLCLAWREGLTRAEISELTWDRVDFDAGLLRLPDREVPLESDAAEMLARWRARCERFSIYVAVSDRLRRRLAPQSVSHLVRVAMDAAEMPDVRLQDLRRDYVRRQLQEHDWPYALRVSGLSVTTYRNSPDLLAEGGDAGEAAPQKGPGEEFLFWRILQEEKDTPAGVALWLSSQVGLQNGEIVRLTWDDVDFDENRIHLPDRDAALTQGARRVLEEALARRAPGEDPHVILTPRTRKPMDSSRLATLVRTALIRGGIEGRSMVDFRRDSAGEDARRALLALAAERGSVSRGEAAELLGLSSGQAYRRLLALAEDGALVRVNTRYYPAEAAVRPEMQAEAIRAYVAESGSVSREDVAELLHIGKRQAGRILRRMVDAGELVLLRRSKRYMLPPAGEELA